MLEDEGSSRGRPDQRPLDALSVDELAARIAALKQEIAACEAMLAQKHKVRAAAESVFGRPGD